MTLSITETNKNISIINLMLICRYCQNGHDYNFDSSFPQILAFNETLVIFHLLTCTFSCYIIIEASERYLSKRLWFKIG